MPVDVGVLVDLREANRATATLRVLPAASDRERVLGVPSGLARGAARFEPWAPDASALDVAGGGVEEALVRVRGVMNTCRQRSV
ncbi:hypothetical protein AB0O87_03495 [Microbacterium sp. NPDC076768]|uniref:hypothetical protein n=1 Tax=Microbacterium sp. NPDC076768 TaxID=3154858 RepID=UPI00341D29E6